MIQLRRPSKRQMDKKPTECRHNTLIESREVMKSHRLMLFLQSVNHRKYIIIWIIDRDQR